MGFNKNKYPKNLENATTLYQGKKLALNKNNGDNRRGQILSRNHLNSYLKLSVKNNSAKNTIDVAYIAANANQLACESEITSFSKNNPIDTKGRDIVIHFTMKEQTY